MKSESCKLITIFQFVVTITLTLYSTSDAAPTPRLRPPTKSTPTFNTTKTFELLAEGEESIVKFNISEAVFVLGITGAGKSTLIKFISGNPGDLSVVQSGRNPVFSDGGKSIGEDTFTSKTLIPEVSTDIQTNTTFLDCPGFDDTKSIHDPTFDIATNYFIKKSLELITKVRFVLVIAHSSVQAANDRHGLIKLLKYICQLFTDVSKFENSISLIVSKVPYDQYTEQQEIDFVVEYFKNAVTYIERLIKSDINNQSLKLHKDMIALIRIIISKQKGDENHKIGMFRKPPSDKSFQLLQKNKEHLRNVILGRNNFIYQKTLQDDFNYYLSDKSKVQIKNTLLPSMETRFLEIMIPLTEQMITTIKIRASNMIINFKKIQYLIDVKQRYTDASSSKYFNTTDNVTEFFSNSQEISANNLHYAKNLTTLLNHFSFFLKVSSTKLSSSYNVISLNQLSKVVAFIEDFSRDTVIVEIKTKTKTVLEESKKEIISYIDTEYKKQKNITILFEFLFGLQQIYTNLTLSGETSESAVTILNVIEQNVFEPDLTLKIRDIISIVNNLKVLFPLQHSLINFRTYGISELTKIADYIDTLVHESLVDKIGQLIQSVISKTQVVLKEQIKSQFENNKNTDSLLKYYESKKVMLENILSTKNIDYSFIHKTFSILKLEVNNKELINEMDYCIDVLQAYNAKWKQFTLNGIFLTFSQVNEDFKIKVITILIPLIVSDIRMVIKDCAQELLEQLYKQCNKLGYSDGLNLYLKNQKKNYVAISEDMDKRNEQEKFRNLTTFLYNNISNVNLRMKIKAIVNILEKTSYLNKLQQADRRYYSEFGVTRIAEIKNSIDEISDWLNVVRVADTTLISYDKLRAAQKKGLPITNKNIDQVLTEISIRRSEKMFVAPNFILEKLNEIYNNIKYSYECNNTVLTVYGLYLSMYEVRTIKCPNQEKLSVLNIFAFGVFYFDSNYRSDHELQINIVAPIWHVVADSEIFLNGETGMPHEDEKPKLTKGKGTDGLRGNPGGPGGSLNGFGLNFVNIERLKITSQGGTGGNGQHGGDGSNGEDPKDPRLPHCIHDRSKWIIPKAEIDFVGYEGIHEYLYYCTNADEELIGSNCENIRSQKRTFYKLTGSDGTTGHDGGAGGLGGEGGYPGLIQTRFFNNEQQINGVYHKGETGRGASGGAGGAGGKKGTITLAEHKTIERKIDNDKTETVYVWVAVKTIRSESYVKSGTDGIFGMGEAVEKQKATPKLIKAPQLIYEEYVHFFDLKGLIENNFHNFLQLKEKLKNTF